MHVRFSAKHNFSHGKVISFIIKYLLLQEFQETSLHHAISQETGGSLHIVDFLVQNSSNLDRKTKEGNTPLHYCVIQNQPEAMRLLLRSGASADLPNNNGKTPLNIARERGYHLCEELVRLWKLLTNNFNLTFFCSYFTLLPVKRLCLKMSTLTGIFLTMMDPRISLMKRPLKTIPEPLTAPLTKREQGPCQYSLLQCPEATQRSFHLVTTDHKGQHLIGQDLTLPTVETVLVLIETLSCLLLPHLSPRNLQYVSQFIYYLIFDSLWCWDYFLQQITVCTIWSASTESSLHA